MTTTELNAEVLRNLSIVAEDENLLRRVAKYLRRVVSEKQNDPTLSRGNQKGDRAAKSPRNTV